MTSFLPELVPIFGMTEQAIYERQRALVRMKLLAAPKGRGRGSGVEASPDTVARLIVAVLATDNLSDTDERVQRLAFAPFIGKTREDRCPLTKARTFVDALAFLLSSEAPIPPWPKRGVSPWVRVQRMDLSASIQFNIKGFSNFGHRDRDRTRLQVEAELPFEALRSIHQRLNLGDEDEKPA